VISDGPISGIIVDSFTPTEGTTLTDVAVATFTDLGGPEDLNSYIATINWGDGSAISPGVVVNLDTTPIPPFDGTTPLPSGLLGVNGTHEYAESGSYLVTVVLQSQDGTVSTATRSVTVADVPQFITGVLNAASDSGASNADGITNVVQPNFIGLTEPNSIVRYFAQTSGGPVTQIGQGVADASGAYSITVGLPLADGSYVITATTVDAAGVTQATATIVNPLVIDTVGPKVTDLRFNRLDGSLLLGLQDDRSGMDRATVIDGQNYFLTRRHAGGSTQTLSTGLLAPPVGPTDIQVVTLTYNRGMLLRRGNFTFVARSGGLADVAGNGLDGEFYGFFPSGNNRPGGDFVARFAAFHRQTNAPQPIVGFNSPVMPPGTPGTTIVFSSNGTTAANAKKAKVALIASRKVSFPKVKLSAAQARQA